MRTILLIGMSVGLSAAAPTSNRAAVVGAVTDCRTIADSSTRLACYDSAVAALDTAATKKDIVVLDREEVRQTRRGLFGFALPKLPFFKGDDSKDTAPTEIVATVQSMRPLGYGKWRVVLDDGAVWDTTEVVRRDPHEGSKVRIKSAVLGSFMMNIDGAAAVRVRRER